MGGRSLLLLLGLVLVGGGGTEQGPDCQHGQSSRLACMAFETDAQAWTGGPPARIEAVGGLLRSSGPFGPPDDHNHDALVGTLALVFWRQFEREIAGEWYGSDFRGATIRLRVRGLDWQPGDSTWRFWIQSRHVDHRRRFANWMYRGVDLTPYLDGRWHTVAFSLSRDPGDWVYAGGRNERDEYHWQDLETSLANIHNIHFPAVYPVGGRRPSGAVEIDWIEIQAPFIVEPTG